MYITLLALVMATFFPLTLLLLVAMLPLLGGCLFLLGMQFSLDKLRRYFHVPSQSMFDSIISFRSQLGFNTK